MTTPTIRDAVSSDDAMMDAIARQGDASADSGYLALVRSQRGRLLVAEAGDRVVGFGGVVDIDGVAMLTDLFVATEARGAGVGTHLLRELFHGTDKRMTFSSKHDAAHAAYRRAGMEPGWRLLYLDGAAHGGGSGLPVEPWQHERASLVDEMRAQGARVTGDVVSMPDENGVWIARVHSPRPVKAVSATLAGLPRGTIVSMCVPEFSKLASWALKSGFAEVDYDTYFATPGVDIPAELHCLHPGLA